MPHDAPGASMRHLHGGRMTSCSIHVAEGMLTFNKVSKVAFVLLKLLGLLPFINLWQKPAGVDVT